MSNQTVSVPTGAIPTLINTGLTPGATIYNSDNANTVWVSSDPSITAGTGIPLGPLGSLAWRGGAVYAVAGTGVTTNTVLNLSSDVGNLDNPVAIGAAVASQLLAKGVPNVLVGAMLISGDIYGNPMPNLSPGSYTWGFRDIDVSAYASLTISINPQAAAQVNASFEATKTGAGASLGGFDFPITGAIGGSVTFVLPVTGPYLNFIINSTIIPYSYSIYGSNRPVDKPRIVNGYSTRWSGNLSQNMVYPTEYPFPTPFLSNGKAVHIHAIVGLPTAPKRGYFGYYTFDGSGAVVRADIVDLSLGANGINGGTLDTTIIIPPGRVSLYFLAIDNGTYNCSIDLVQEIA